MKLGRFPVVGAVAVVVAGCSSSSSHSTCAQTGCSNGQVCESLASGGGPACFDPVYVAGRVYDLANTAVPPAGIGGARVVGQDANGAPVSAVAATGVDGSYVFETTLPVTRNSDGSPASGSITLRADARGYEAFPSRLRTALPVALTTNVTHAGGRWTVQSSLTNIGLRAIASAPAGEITGTVKSLPAGGALVVAECGGVAYTAVPGTDGTYGIFNVPDCSCRVIAYAKGLNYTRIDVTVAAGGANPAIADLAPSSVPTATVSGSIQVVSTTFWPTTSILLVVASTYDAGTHRGIAPPGLKVSDVGAGAWSISGIPDGHYRVLAAFETDYLVRDPSDIGGTAVLEFQVLNGVPLLMDGTTSASTIQGFKITGAIRLEGPIADAAGACTTLASLPSDPRTLPVGGCTAASATPTFAWEAYSSTSYYEVTVIDELGLTQWQADVAPNSGTVSVVYGTPAGTGNVTTTLTPAATLASGATYQMRLVAYKAQSTTSIISTSEDLIGVFTIP